MDTGDSQGNTDPQTPAPVRPLKVSPTAGDAPVRDITDLNPNYIPGMDAQAPKHGKILDSVRHFMNRPFVRHHRFVLRPRLIKEFITPDSLAPRISLMLMGAGINLKRSCCFLAPTSVAIPLALLLAIRN